MLSTPSSLQCVGITHTHPDTSHAALTAACQSMKSHYSATGMCEISRLTGGGQRHTRCNQCKQEFSVCCAWLFCWLIEQRSEKASLGTEVYLGKNLVFLLSLYVIITSWDCHLEIHAGWTKQAPGSQKNSTELSSLSHGNVNSNHTTRTP